jgi:hypothetical protein
VPLLLIWAVSRAGHNEFDQDCWSLRRRLRGSGAQLRIDGTQFRVQVGSGGHRHRITAPVIGGGIAHDREHVVDRQNAGRLSRNASFFCRTVARTLLSSTGPAAARNGFYC